MVHKGNHIAGSSNIINRE